MALSNTLLCPVVSATSKPAAPTSLILTGGGESNVVLNWTAPAGATTYNVYRRAQGGGGYTLLATGLVSTTYTDSALANGTIYFYVVTAVNSFGESPPSNEVTTIYVLNAYVAEDGTTYYVAEDGLTFYVQEFGAPAAPTSLAVTGQAATTISLSWTASAGAATYNLYQGTTPGGESGTPVQTLIAGTTATATGLSSGTAYYFTVKAVNSSGTSTASNEATGTTIPSAPTITALGGTGSVVVGMASPVTGATTYNLQWSTTSGGTYAAVSGGTGLAYGSFPFNDTNAAANASATTGLIFYQAQAVGAGGSSAFSTAVSGPVYSVQWGIIDWWNLDGLTPAIGSDTLTNNNSVAFGTHSPPGNAATFVAASSKYLSHASNSSLQAGNIDWFECGWINLATISADQDIIAKYQTSDAASEYEIFFETSTKQMVAKLYSGAGTNKFVRASTFGALSAATDYFWFAYIDSVNHTVNISVNGGAFNSTSLAGFTPQATSAIFSMGCYSAGGGNFLNGTLGSVVFGKNPPGGIAALASAIATKIYNAGSGRAAPFNG